MTVSYWIWKWSYILSISETISILRGKPVMYTIATKEWFSTVTGSRRLNDVFYIRDGHYLKESLRILKADLLARPVFVWDDYCSKGYFSMCYMQYLIENSGMEILLA